MNSHFEMRKAPIDLSSVLNALRTLKHGTRRSWHQLVRTAALKLLRITTGGRVVGGLFAQLRLDAQHVFGAAGAKLLGTYELEIAPTLERIGSSTPAIVIDVGGADGYYAVGFARHWRCPVIVFERLAHAREIIARNGALNAVGVALELRGNCDEAALYALVQQHPQTGFLMMDVEGAELDLISERVARALDGWEVLIETHDFARPGCLVELERRLATCHDLERIESRPRQLTDFPSHLKLTKARKLELMDEQRPGIMTWLAGRPRAAPAQ